MTTTISNPQPVLRLTVFTLLFLVGLFLPAGASEITPERDINIIGETVDQPDWKKSWDTARQYVREEKFESAILFYKKALKLKPNVEEIKWEQFKLSVEISRYDEASILLESLLELDANNVEYLLKGGTLALAMNKHAQAIELFGQVLEIDPVGGSYELALKGMIEAMQGQGKTNLAIPLMEQLYQSEGGSKELLINLAQSYRLKKDSAKAHFYYMELINKYRVAPELLYDAASLNEQLGNMQEAIELYERFLKEQPDSLYLRIKVADYYLQNNKDTEAYPHLTILLDNQVNRQRYLLEAGRINLYTFGRADKALRYYETYSFEYPEGIDVSRDVEHIRLILANNLLAIVENDGVTKLWSDLNEITADRIGIYRAMADLLEALNKKKELTEVLQLLSFHEPDDVELKMRLSALYFEKKRFKQCVETLTPLKTAAQTLPKDYYQLRFRCEKQLNDDFLILESYSEYLKIYPRDNRIRSDALNIAGELGDIKAVNALAVSPAGLPQNPSRLDYLVIKAGADAYVKSNLYAMAQNYLLAVISQNSFSHHYQLGLQLEHARLQQLQEKRYVAEQLLRIAAANNPEDSSVYNELASAALANKDYSSVPYWLQRAEQYVSNITDTTNKTNHSLKIFINTLKYYSASGSTQEMIEKAESYLASRQGKLGSSYERQVFNLLSSYYYQSGFYQKYHDLVTQYIHDFYDHLFATVLINSTPSLSVKYDPELIKASLTAIPVSQLTQLFTYFMTIGEPEGARIIHEKLRQTGEAQLREMLFRAQLYVEQFQYDKASALYKILAEKYPDEIYFSKLQERYTQYSGIKQSPGSPEDLTYVSFSPEMLDSARLLWEAGEQKQALQIYDTIEQVLQSRLQAVTEQIKNDSNYVSATELSFWESWLDEDQDIQILDRAMDPEIFAANLGGDTALKTAQHYTDYRWYKVAVKERKARQALYQKEFYQAEKRYQELLEEDVPTTDVIGDLATVYNRLGRYAKETELLEKIKEKQIKYPSLEAVVQTNISRRRPELSISGLFRKEEGRGGDIDIKQQSFGIGLSVLPTLYQETGFQIDRNIYGNRLDNSILTSNSINGNYALYFGRDSEFRATLGFEDIEEVGNAYVIYDAVIKGRIAESVEGRISMDQELVSDTIQSLSEGILKRDYSVGLTIDYLPKIFLGFDAIYRTYNDDNEGKRINLWASYRIFSEVNTFDFTYDYTRLDNRIDSTGGATTSDPERFREPGYWSPGKYWKHNLTALWKRELWPLGKDQRGSSYFEAHYSIGYESEENLIQQAGFDILLEISKPFLLKGTLVSDWSDDFDRIQGYCSLVYRW